MPWERRRRQRRYFELKPIGRPDVGFSLSRRIASIAMAQATWTKWAPPWLTKAAFWTRGATAVSPDDVAPAKRSYDRRSNPILFTPRQVTMFLDTFGAVALKQLDNRDDDFDIFHTIIKKSKTTMIHPNSNFRRFWDICTAINVVLVCVMMPLDLAFDKYMESLSWPAPLETFFDVYFIIDIVLTFRTGFIASGEVVMDAKEVAKHYAESWLVIDIVSNFPFKYLMDNATSNPKSVKFLKLQKIPKLLRFTRLLKYMRQYAKYYKFVLTFCIMVLSLHAFSCLWVYIYFECNDDVFDDSSDLNCTVATLQISPIYLQALTNVVLLYLGFGQVSTYKPITLVLHSPDEKASPTSYLLSLAIIALGVTTTSIMLGNVISLIISWDQQNSLFRNRMDVISSEMKHYDLPLDLQRRVRRNYDYLWLNQRAYSEMSILNQHGISQPTRTTIALHLYRDLIESVPYFAGEDARFLGRVCLALKTSVFLPGDMIIQQGDTGREMFFVRRGRVQVELPTGPPHVELKDGDFFGETALVVDVRRTNNVRAITICDLNELSKAAFDDILSEFPDFFDKIKKVVIERQLHNMNIKSEKDKALIKAEITDVVNATTTQRNSDVTSPYWQVLHAKRIGNKLKTISDRIRVAQERNPRMTTVLYRPRPRVARRRSAVPKRGVSKKSLVSPASIRRLLEAIEVPLDDEGQLVEAVVRLTNGIPTPGGDGDDDDDDESSKGTGGPSLVATSAATPEGPCTARKLTTTKANLTRESSSSNPRTRRKSSRRPTSTMATPSHATEDNGDDVAAGDGPLLSNPSMADPLAQQMRALESLSNRLAVMEKSAAFMPMFIQAFEDAMKNVTRDVEGAKQALLVEPPSRAPSGQDDDQVDESNRSSSTTNHVV
ncbi:Aste57867_21941 [Aphanomyces stellatus]|uniref:Aste57867_21941 protein n=1 Tax=Aphanomyces stellatus TaxID=120398 RepID=A0A485LKY0_9STRA|nr:hypothetical protein As57867_021872 [Aphanomyces stellatus]VFT98609.1 Aste57867_21941 [Aphanomyces stellatus]